jgi:hypothetical protein
MKENKPKVTWQTATKQQKRNAFIGCFSFIIIFIVLIAIIFGSNNYSSSPSVRSNQELQDSIDFIEYGKFYKSKREKDPNYKPLYK